MKTTTSFRVFKDNSDDVYYIEAVGADEALAEAFCKEYVLAFHDTSPVTVHVDNAESATLLTYKFWVLKEGGFRCELVSTKSSAERVGFGRPAARPTVVSEPIPGHWYALPDHVPPSCIEVLFHMDDGSVQKGCYSKGLAAVKWVYVKEID